MSPETPPAGPVTVRQAGAVLSVELTSADGVNGLTRQGRQELLAALTGPAADPAVRAVVLRGRGRAFCVGQALDEHAARLAADPEHAFDCVAEEYAPLVRALRALAKPVVAGVDGACAGAGVALALACDVRVVSDRARFTLAFTSIGLGADSGLTSTLVRAVGAPRATALLLLDRPMAAEQAAALGLVDVLVPAAAFDDELDAVVGRLAAGPTAAYAAVKRTAHQAETASYDEVLALEAAAQRELGLTADHQGAVAAFLAKQPPTFTGR